jgi:hypothetical protein
MGRWAMNYSTFEKSSKLTKGFTAYHQNLMGISGVMYWVARLVT